MSLDVLAECLKLAQVVMVLIFLLVLLSHYGGVITRIVVTIGTLLGISLSILMELVWSKCLESIIHLPF